MDQCLRWELVGGEVFGYEGIEEQSNEISVEVSHFFRDADSINFLALSFKHEIFMAMRVTSA